MFCHGVRVRAAGLGSADRECSRARARYTWRKGYRIPCVFPLRRTHAHTYTQCLCARNTTMIFANDHKTVCYYYYYWRPSGARRKGCFSPRRFPPPQSPLATPTPTPTPTPHYRDARTLIHAAAVAAAVPVAAPDPQFRSARNCFRKTQEGVQM